jgi:hypothetical protein
MRILGSLLIVVASFLHVLTATDDPPALCVYWAQGVDTKPRLDAAGITHVCVPQGQVEAWRAAGVDARGLSGAELGSREILQAPGIVARTGVASPTRAPWIAANGWRIVRSPVAKFVYDAPSGKAALAAAEAFAYTADAVIKIDPADLESLGSLVTFLRALPAVDLPTVADFAIVDDGSPVTGEAMNLLARRNLLFEIVKAPSARYPLNIAIGSPEYPAQEAADPSAFAQKVRQRLGDNNRSLRIYGSEVVIGRLTADGSRARLQLLNYGGRDIEGLRVRLRGIWSLSAVHVSGVDATVLSDLAAADGFTEFSVPRLTTYGVIDLSSARQ